jgi:hypothetical protein
MRTILTFAALGIGTSLLAGCPDRNVSEVDPNQNKVEDKNIPVNLNRDIDILFVVDNSGSMAEEQAGLTTNFPLFINVLNSIDGGLPNIHLGVVTSDMGAGSVPGCNNPPSTRDGLLQTDNTVISGSFIVDTAATPGTGNCPTNPDRDCNYTGTLANAFSDIASVGTAGCGFEQHMESMRAALNGSNSFNAGFLRDSAFLAVVFIQDEDDCSTRDDAMFDTSQNSADAPLGFLASFRCTEFGVDCETGNSDPRAPGPRTNCFPRDPSPYMYGVQEYADFLKSLKPQDPKLVIVAGIAGNAEPFVVGTDPMMPTHPALVPSCESANGKADPAVRLKFLLDQFPERNAFTTICNDDLSDALQLIAELLKKAIGNPCIQSTLRDPYDCSVSDVVNPGTDNETETLLPKCNADEDLDPDNAPNSTNIPCWHLDVDTTACPETPTQLALIIERAGASAPTGTHVIAQCVTCTDENANGVCDDTE